MKPKAVTVFFVLFLALGTAGLAEEAATPAVAEGCASAIDLDQATLEEMKVWAIAIGGVVDDRRVEADDLPTCPLPISCPPAPCGGGGGVFGEKPPCLNRNCSTTDLGFSACQAGSAVVSCPSGQTIHQQTCTCKVVIGTPSCPPGTICGSSRSVFCQ